MLTKLPRVEHFPGSPYVPAVPPVPYSPARTVCGPEQRDSWTEYECSNTKVYFGANSGIEIPWGATVVRVGEDDGGLYAVIRVCRTVTKYGPPKPPVCVDYPEQPAVPGTPARPAVPPSTRATPLFGWDAGANSETIIEGPSRLWFEQPAVIGAVIGYTTDRAAVPAVDRYAHAFYFYQTSSGQPRFALREFSRVFAADTPYVPGDEFEIKVAGGRADYLHNGELFRRSSTRLAGELSIGTTLYASGDTAPGYGGGGAPEPEPGLSVDFYSTYGHGGGNGMFIIDPDDESQFCNEEARQALISARDNGHVVWLAGTKRADTPPGCGVEPPAELDPPFEPWMFVTGHWSAPGAFVLGNFDGEYDNETAYYVGIWIESGGAGASYVGLLWMGSGI